MASLTSVGVGVVVVFVMWTTTVCAKHRVYFVGAVEREWDYAPGGGDLTAYSPRYSHLQQRSQSETFLNHTSERIGRKYMKAMYREFTDASFSQETAREEWMGLLGPVLGGDEGDNITVVFRNMARISGRSFSMHPHGLKYTKAHEGALYQDDTSGAQKKDESVGPGEEYVYRWTVSPEVSPARDDPDCITWTYHSHVDSVQDVNSGLVGILLTCRPGGLERNKRTYARQFAMVVNIFDENHSWYIDYNIRTYLPRLSSQDAQVLKEDAEFQKSNRMGGFNGLMYGHLRGLDMCVDTLSLWHVIGFGSEMDVHSLSVNGHSFLVNQHRVDALHLNPVEFITAELEALEVGEWLVRCSVLNHVHEGMVALLNVSACGHHHRPSRLAEVQRFKHYYIAINEVDWDYAPSGKNLFDGQDLLKPNSSSEKYFKEAPGGVYLKAVFRQYRDMTFSSQTKREAEDEHLGYLGPVLRVEVGDAVALTLKNNARQQAYSINPHGARVLKKWEGALYNDHTDHEDDVVQPGQVRTTYWIFPESMGPGPMDPPCITRLYTSSSLDVVRDAYSGLVGPILICRKGALDERGRQLQVDREFFLMLSVTDENLSWYSDDNLGRLRGPDQTASQDFYESHLMHSINGYVYGNLPGLTMCLGDRVSWHLLGVGSARDVHTAYFHGQPLTLLDTRESSTPVLPGYFKTLFMKAENPGQWALVDQTAEQYDGGAKALFYVNPCGLRQDRGIRPTHANHRTYFLQAEESLWDYMPTGMDKIGGTSLGDQNGDAYIFSRSDGPYLGKQYKKVRYREYTDATFTTKVERPESDGYLGILGPVIMAEAFDVITVVFRNMASRPYSVHAQGLFYTKTSEGSPYAGSSGEVQHGETVTYEWSVPVDFAPAEGDPACINRAYYSAVDPVRDTESGLLGPLVICKPGTLDGKGRRTDVDEFFVVLFKIFDEGQSWYLEQNIQLFGQKDSRQAPKFGESNLMHSINGYMFANNPPMSMTEQDGVAWHLMTLGQQADLHSVHWHGNQFIAYSTGQHTGDVVQLFPGTFSTVWMNATHKGKWLLHCHVHDHVTGGMETVYVVKPSDPFGGDLIGAN